MTKDELIQLIQKHAQIENLQYDTNLHDAGVDSIQFVNIIVELEAITNISFDSEDVGLVTFNTINELFKLLSENTS